MNEIRLVCVDFLFVCLFFVEILINFKMFVAFVALFVEIVLNFENKNAFVALFVDILLNFEMYVS